MNKNLIYVKDHDGKVIETINKITGKVRKLNRSEEEKYNLKLERNRAYKHSEKGAESNRKSYNKYYANDDVKEKKRQYYLMKKEEKRLKALEETGEEPPIRGRGRPRKEV